jgi:type IV secretory pathway ATPase VirB11/archaellum biosynthesis ATPase
LAWGSRRGIPNHWIESENPAESRVQRLESVLRIQLFTKQKSSVSNPFPSYQLDDFEH